MVAKVDAEFGVDSLGRTKKKVAHSHATNGTSPVIHKKLQTEWALRRGGMKWNTLYIALAIYSVACKCGSSTAQMNEVFEQARQVSERSPTTTLSRCESSMGRSLASIDENIAPRSMRVYDNTLYWIDAAGALYSLPAEGGTTRILRPQPDRRVDGVELVISVDGAFILLQDSQAKGTVLRRTLDGSVTTAMEGTVLGNLIANNDGVYAMRSAPLDESGPAGAIWHYSPARSASTPIVKRDFPGGDLTSDKDSLYWVEHPNEARGQQGNNTIVRSSKDGRTQQVLTSSKALITYLAQDDSHLYWLQRSDFGTDDARLMKMRKTGEEPTEIGPLVGTSLTLLNGGIFYRTESTKDRSQIPAGLARTAVVRRDLTTHEERVVLDDACPTLAYVIDGDRIFWATAQSIRSTSLTAD